MTPHIYCTGTHSASPALYVKLPATRCIRGILQSWVCVAESVPQYFDEEEVDGAVLCIIKLKTMQVGE